jgi:hypothetical protein
MALLFSISTWGQSMQDIAACPSIDENRFFWDRLALDSWKND